VEGELIEPVHCNVRAFKGQHIVMVLMCHSPGKRIAEFLAGPAELDSTRIGLAQSDLSATLYQFIESVRHAPNT
jgi:hypothetical protein